MGKSERIDQLIQFAILTAGQEDEYIDRWLGPIHLVKYVYLADLAFARENQGQTYTGVPWRFHHYGPWEYSCFERIEPALAAIGAEKKIVPSKFYEDDYDRWCLRDSRLHDELQEKLPISVAGTMHKYVHQFGIDTNGLLHFVYKTHPMITAAPGDTLDFTKELEAIETSSPDTEDDTCKLTARQMKKRKEALRNIKSGLRAMLDKRRKEESFRPNKPDFALPRYDKIYLQGLEDLDRMAGSPPEEGDYRVIFSDDVWKSKARFDPDLS
jgi:hypothetical protein